MKVQTLIKKLQEQDPKADILFPISGGYGSPVKKVKKGILHTEHAVDTTQNGHLYPVKSKKVVYIQ